MVEVIEKVESRSRSEDSAELIYLVRGTADGIVARQAVEQVTPPDYDDLLLDSISVEPEWVDEATNAGEWLCTVRYRRPEAAQIAARQQANLPQMAIAFDTTGGTEHINFSRKTILRIKPASHDYAEAPSMGGAIGVDGEQITGCDITVPVYKFTETHYFSDQFVNAAYRRTLFELTGTVNDKQFRDFDAGEVLFLGASGSKRGQGDWEITFHFAVSPNRRNWCPDNLWQAGFAKFDKDGWDYMWVHYGNDISGGVLVKKPKAVYIERVYPRANFQRLKI